MDTSLWNPQVLDFSDPNLLCCNTSSSKKHCLRFHKIISPYYRNICGGGTWKVRFLRWLTHVSWQVLTWEVEPSLSTVGGYLNWGLAPFFCKGPDRKELRLSRTFCPWESTEYRIGCGCLPAAHGPQFANPWEHKLLILYNIYIFRTGSASVIWSWFSD